MKLHGLTSLFLHRQRFWIPAFAGMTKEGMRT